MKQRAKARAPATVANVACGFDVFGFALNDPADEVVAVLSDKPGVRIRSMVGDSGRLPRDADKNTASVAVMAMLQDYGKPLGIELELVKNLPLASGLGSSAASAVAALVAVNEVLGNPYSKQGLLPFAMEGERLACGTAHADNAAPSLLGGFVVVRSYSPLDVISIPTPELLHCAVAHPNVEVRTEDARRVIKQSIPLSMAVAYWGNAAALIAGLYSGDFNVIGRSLHDAIFEPDRAGLIPGFHNAQKAAMKAGALGCSISGSGPSVFSLCDSYPSAVDVANAMQSAFATIGLKSNIYVSAINRAGACIIED